jgi:adenosylcobinamide-phosphate synthase
MAWSLALANGIGLLAGAVMDAVLGDPRRLHPVAGYGRAVAAIERRMYRPTRLAGAQFAAVAVGVPVAAGCLATWASRRRPPLRAALMAAVTWAALGGRSLRDQAQRMAAEVAAGDLAAARARLPNLCGRDPSDLGREELCRATLESVAENTCDAVVAPLAWAAVAGLPGVMGYRAVNTLDAMVGHRSPRYARFGTASAWLDDLANLAPSRATAILTAIAAPHVGGDRGAALRTWLRDGHRHPSPNSGQSEAAMAGALGVQLGGANVYDGRIEVRPALGRGRASNPEDLNRAARICAQVTMLATAMAVGHLIASPARRRLAAAGLRASRCALRRPGDLHCPSVLRR